MKILAYACNENLKKITREDALMLDGAPSGDYSVVSVGQFDENMKQLGKCVNLLSYPQLGRSPR